MAPEYVYIAFDMLPNEHGNTYRPWEGLGLSEGEQKAVSEMHLSVKEVRVS